MNNNIISRHAYYPIIQSPYLSRMNTPKTFGEIFPHVKLRMHQKQALEGINRHKRSVMLHHRRSGKDTLAWLWILFRAITIPNSTHHYYFPTRRLGALIIEESMGTIGGNLLSLVPYGYLKPGKAGFDKTNKVLYFKNGSTLLIRGLDLVTSVGSEGISFVFSELAVAKNGEGHDYLSYIWEAEAVRNQAKIVYVSTPRGKNFYYEICEEVKREGGFYHKVTIEDTGIVSQENLAAMRKRGVSEDKIQQELFCSFLDIKEDKIYDYELDMASYSGQIDYLHANVQDNIYTAWDLGVRDFTCIIIFSVGFSSDGGLQIKILDFIKDKNKSLHFYIKTLSELKYNYKWHFIPFDAENRNLTDLKAFSDHFRVGLVKAEEHRREKTGFLCTLKRSSVVMGINQVQEFFPTMLFNKPKTEELIKDLYKYKWSEQTIEGHLKEKPCHDDASHSADALRYMVQGIIEKNLNIQKKTPVLDGGSRSRWDL